MILDSRPILVLAPHTDDGELGCGGSIARLCQLGYSVVYYAFCSCDESLPKGFEQGTLKRELFKATNVLGISSENIFVDNFAVRRLSYFRQEVLECLYRLSREIDPQIVFCPTRDDLHQDHAVVASEAQRAFKDKTILGYEMPWNNIIFNANYIIRLEEQHIELKINALKQYTSQAQRAYLDEKFIRSLAQMRGVTVNAVYAEAFTLYRAVL
jgi:LmbE family N-acetylglucosaminyl deacetylase